MSSSDIHDVKATQLKQSTNLSCQRRPVVRIPYIAL